LESFKHATQGTKLYNPERDAANISMHSHDAGICGLTTLSEISFMFGDQKPALDFALQAKSLADRLGNPMLIMHALMSIQYANYYCGDHKIAAEAAKNTLSISENRPFPLFVPFSRAIHGILSIRDGDDGGMEEILAGRLLLEKLGFLGFLPYVYVLELEGRLLTKNAEPGILSAKEIISSLKKLPYQLEEEVHRLYGELIYMKSTASAQEAEAEFITAKKLAHERESYLFELRAALSLGRLWQSQGRSQEAKSVVKESLILLKNGHGIKDYQEGEAFLL